MKHRSALPTTHFLTIVAYFLDKKKLTYRRLPKTYGFCEKLGVRGVIELPGARAKIGDWRRDGFE
jgi:hypothetical protein